MLPYGPYPCYHKHLVLKKPIGVLLPEETNQDPGEDLSLDKQEPIPRVHVKSSELLYSSQDSSYESGCSHPSTTI